MKNLVVSIQKEEHNQLKAKAALSGTNISELVRSALYKAKLLSNTNNAEIK